MKYKLDNDLHIHTRLSVCSNDEEQTPANILQIAKERGLKTICITDHYWDDLVSCNSKYNWWYRKQNYARISQSLPLPQTEGICFLFGCETDLDSSYRVGIPMERWDDFDFIIISTTHFHHMIGKEWENCSEEDLARLWVKRFEAVLDTDLPFKKVGIAHLACEFICMNNREGYLRVLNLIPTEDMKRLFIKAARLGVGIELNYEDLKCKDEEVEIVFRMFRIAKECGCKFYLASDAHTRKAFEGVDAVFARAVDILGLQEKDKFNIINVACHNVETL